MSISTKPSSKPQSSSDSFFGMALAQAFLGFAYGPVTEQIWDAGEIASAVYEDREGAKPKNGHGYKIGVTQSLADDFARSTKDDFQPVPALSFGFFHRQPAPAFTF